jgi:hypothetical protein
VQPLEKINSLMPRKLQKVVPADVRVDNKLVMHDRMDCP